MDLESKKYLVRRKEKRNYIIKAEEEKTEETQEKAAGYANHPEEQMNRSQTEDTLQA